MDITLLNTKLHMPVIRPGLVSRPRLIDRLDVGRDRKLALVSAAAGSGKTTLLGEWVNRLPHRAAWLSLDDGDNDQIRFWIYMIAALQTVNPDLGRDAQRFLQAPQQAAVQAILTTLLNELAALPDETVLVLDDYHLISERAIHEGVAFLLDHLPRNVHLVISTRADPPLPTYRLRARGQLIELRSADLRFTADEAAAFLNATMGLDLASEDVEALEARTEGWIVGLQLAALSLQDRADAHEFITAFGGGHHFVLEYLAEEVVRRQSSSVQGFLMRTSILNRLCGSLCDALTGEGDGEATLAYLRKRNLFILALDDEYRWVRYHRLFADLLSNLLRRQYSEKAIRELHVRACDWYDRQGWTAEAVHHALAAKDYERTARLIEANSLAMVTRGELATLLRWIRALPEAVAHSRPWLCVHQAWPLTLAGQAAAAEPLLREIERRVPLEGATAGDKEILGNAAAMRAMLATFHGDMAQAIELARRADELLPADNLIPRSTIPYILASAYYAEGELGKAGQALTEEFEIGQAAGNPWTIVRSLCDLADLHILQGQLRPAADLCQQALQQAEERGARQFGTVGYALVKLGEILYEQGELIAARDRIREGLALMQGWQQPYEMVVGYTTQAVILQALDDAEGARAALHNAATIQSQHPNYYKLAVLVHESRVRLCLARGELEEAARQAIESRLGETGAPLFREQGQLNLARALVAQQRWSEALSHLMQLAEATEAGGRFGRLIEARALQALAWQGQGEAARALEALEQALTLGEVEGHVRVFVDLGQPMVRMLQQAASRGLAPQYVATLLAACGIAPEEPVTGTLPLGVQPLVEPLTGRELEVLHLVGEGRSNREIAKALVITVNSVKKHASNIYGKLGVHSRTQAVVRAQELGLL